ncbi:MAG: MotA/TolQ/ExbB proton channel family protein [Alcanivorax sp.]|jgi:biopolymer transport protein ExbB|nr:MotA/TolQ/ExbB proton channel family protein [Pseudomonas sp.]PHR97302.1 MAG: flagellar motor protein MotA [Oceanobacter sp.]
MKYFIIIACLLSLTNFSVAEDLITSAKEFRQFEAQINQAREAAFSSDLKQQQTALAEAKKLLKQAQETADDLKVQFADNEEQITKASEALRLRTGSLGEMFGVVRQVANDLKSTTADSLVRTNAELKKTPVDLNALASSKALPKLEDLKALWQTLRQEANLSGEITEFKAPTIQKDGSTQTQELVRIGAFSVISTDGYFLWDEQLQAFRLLARQPNEAGLIPAYLSGSSMANLAIDPSRGALLSINSVVPAWSERIQQGGTVGYIIMALGVIGLCLALWRLIALAVIEKGVRTQLSAVDTPSSNNALGRIIGVAQLDSATVSPSTNSELLEARLDEAVLKELPAIERGQGIIKLLAGVAPLLGLLGTVTGMIATFQAITAFGSGDAKLMASGISQALITTVLGLVVAVPLLLLHSWVASRSRALVQILDEQSAGIIAQSLEDKNEYKNEGIDKESSK